MCIRDRHVFSTNSVSEKECYKLDCPVGKWSQQEDDDTITQCTISKYRTCLTASSCMLVVCSESVDCFSWHFNESINSANSVLSVLSVSSCAALPTLSLPVNSWQSLDTGIRCWWDELFSSACRRSISACHQHTTNSFSSLLWDVGNLLPCDAIYNKTLHLRDVNFGFFRKSIIVLKKSIFFRLSNFGVAHWWAPLSTE